jgi:hypothetical protein
MSPRASHDPTAAQRQRLHAQLLTTREATDPVEVVERITAVQAQDPRGFRLAVRARSHVPSACDVDRCLTDDRSLVVDWLCRGTLHLVRAEDHAWIHALTSRGSATTNATRLRQEGVSPEQAERGVALIEAALRDDGPLTRDQLRERLDAAGVPTARQALVHLLGAASMRGACLRGPMVEGQQAFAHPAEWLGPRPVVDIDAALRELALRYLRGHAPASDRDLATWSGLGLRDVRRGLSLLGPLVVTRADGLLELADAEAGGGIPEPRLLGAFDPILHGWASRAEILGPHTDGVVTTNGIFRPFALVDARAVATWGLAAGEVTIMPLPGERLSRATAALLDADARAVRAYVAGQDDGA